jgi:hypothetical protein
MKYLNLLLVFLILLSFLACDKDEEIGLETIDEEILGKWEFNKPNFVLTPKGDIKVFDFYGLPWTGNISCTYKENKTSDSSFVFVKDNVFGGLHWYSDKFYVSKFSDGLFLTLYDTEFLLTNAIGLTENFVLDINGKALPINCDTIMFVDTLLIEGKIEPEILFCKAGKEIELRDGHSHEKLNFISIEFLDDGTFVGQLLDLDMLIDVEGKWNKKGENLSLIFNYFYSETPVNKDYKVLIEDNQFIWIENIALEEYILRQLALNYNDIKELKYSISLRKVSNN